jgi:hypothetical protein
MEYSRKCECEAREASFNFRDDIMPPEVISRIYCPNCSSDIDFNSKTMIADNGWIIEYDMEVAEFSAHKMPLSQQSGLSPEMLFDEGYATWRGIYPGDHIDNVREREEVTKLAKTDPRQYLERIKNWSIQRMARLKEEGWRKANVN